MVLQLKLNHKNNLVEEANQKLKPLRDKNIEILSKLQRLNLEFQNLEDEEKRIKTDKDRLKEISRYTLKKILKERKILF